MLLWNAVMPDVFHVPEISIWQAAGISFLCGVLFHPPQLKQTDQPTAEQFGDAIYTLRKINEQLAAINDQISATEKAVNTVARRLL
jgi:hypothetical protein